MGPRLSSASWNVAEGALDQTIAILTQGESSARARALLVEARRLRSRIASWRAIPPPPAARKEAFDNAMHLLRKAGEMPLAGASDSAPPPSSGIAEASRAASSAPAPAARSSAPPRDPFAFSSAPPPKVPSIPPPRAPSIPPARLPSSIPAAAPPIKREVISPGVTVLRPRGLEWTAVARLEGVEIKVLEREENGLYRAVLRLAAGAQIPRHKHKLAEDIVLLEGTLVTDGVTMRAGELCHSEIGSIHAASVAPTGCTLLVIGSEKNEVFSD